MAPEKGRAAKLSGRLAMDASLSEVATVGAALVHAKACGLPRLDTQLLLQALLQQSPAGLLANPETPLTPAQQATFLSQLAACCKGVPLAYVLGEWPFAGLRLKVTPAVLVPRPETEGLVHWALQCLHGLHAPQVLDLGTGSGAIALAIKAARPDAQVWASDAHANALAVAMANAQRLGLAVQALPAAPWWQAAPAGQRFSLVVANPPYIAPGDAHLAALAHEPPHALVAPEEGLADLRAIVAGAPAHLHPGAWLLLEHGHDQAGALAQMFAQAGGWQGLATRHDLAGLPRCSGAQWAVSAPP